MPYFDTNMFSFCSIRLPLWSCPPLDLRYHKSDKIYTYTLASLSDASCCISHLLFLGRIIDKTTNLKMGLSKNYHKSKNYYLVQKLVWTPVVDLITIGKFCVTFFSFVTNTSSPNMIVTIVCYD